MILVLGYYDKHNLGDEAYKMAFPLLLAAEYANTPIVFANPHNLAEIPKDTKLVICGGGDIIENWFKKIFDVLLQGCHCPVYAVSIGITYPSTINSDFLGHFEKIYVRHNAYSSELSGVVGTHNVNHIPDIAFLIPPIVVSQPQPKQRKKIGVFMAPLGETTISSTLNKLLLSLRDVYDIIFYSFNTSKLEHEGDAFYTRRVFSQFETVDNVNSVNEMLTVMSTLSFCICVRYHSHVFSIIQNVPFVSLALTPKSQMLMKDFGYTQNVAHCELEIEQAIRFVATNRRQLKAQNEATRGLCLELLKSVRIFEPRNLSELEGQSLKMLEMGHCIESVVAFILFYLTGSFKNKYTYGFVENLKNQKHPLQEMLRWIRHDHKPNSGEKLHGHNHPNVAPHSETAYNTICLMQKAESFANVHRSGWQFTVGMLGQLHSDSGLLCDTYSDGTFLWNESNMLNQGLIPFKKPWIGILHHTQVETCGENNLVNLFDKQSFRLSLRQCKGLITLSKYTQAWLQNKLQAANLNIRVFSIKHPTETVGPQAIFNMNNFRRNPSIVQIGAWLRDPYAIYQLQVPWATKKVLGGPSMESYMHPLGLSIRDGSKCIPGVCNVHVKQEHRNKSYSCGCFAAPLPSGAPGVMCRPPSLENVLIQYILQYLWQFYAHLMPDCVCVSHSDGTGCKCGNFATSSLPAIDAIVQANYATVTQIPQLPNDQYDALLSQSVVFIKLEDASAVNTVIECIMRNTPIIVNRLPAVVEYLGPRYPLYYDHVNQVSTFTNAQIAAASNYLMKMNKKDLMVDTFIGNFKKILNQL
jgi:polysaccharide pyruvyl transferase WcaK-like protein